MNLKTKITNFKDRFFYFSNYWKNEKGVAAIEAAYIFPLLLTMIMGVHDLGRGVVINQKVSSASQIMGDLLARYETVDVSLIQDIVRAGELAIAPYPIDSSFGYDVASVAFDEDENPETLWRYTSNMATSDDPINDTVGLGGEGEGVVVVSVTYEYQPFFSNFIVNDYVMSERAFLKGRKSLTVPCTDCP